MKCDHISECWTLPRVSSRNIALQELGLIFAPEMALDVPRAKGEAQAQKASAPVCLSEVTLDLEVLSINLAMQGTWYF